MRPLFLIPLIAALFVCLKVNASETTGSTTNLETRFCERGVLSASEIADVVTLAKDCGVEHPVSISTHYILPITRNWDYIIQVKGAEKISGRRISYLTAAISRGQSDATKLKSHGKFWVARGDISFNNFALFTVGDREIRVGLARTFPLDKADKIIAAFAAKRFRYPSDQADWKQTLETFDFANGALEGSVESNKYKITVGLCEVEFHLDKDTIDVVRVSTFII